MAIWLRHARCADDGTPDPERRAVGACSDVLTATEFGALVTLDEGYRQLASDREAILGAAREEAARLVAAGEARAAELVEAARRECEQAAEVGYRKGELKAIADWTARIAQVGDAQTLVYARMRERLATVVSLAVEKIIAVHDRSLMFERALVEIDRIADGSTYLNITVHPDDLSVARVAFDELSARWRDLGQAFPVSVKADPSVKPGACIAESDVGAIDASLDTQLSAMRSAVSRALKRTVPASERDVNQPPAAPEIAPDSTCDSPADDVLSDFDAAFAYEESAAWGSSE